MVRCEAREREDIPLGLRPLVSGQRTLLEKWREAPGEQTSALGDGECWAKIKGTIFVQIGRSLGS